MNCKQEARNGTCEPNTLRRLHGVHGGKSQSSARDSLRNPDLHFSEASELLGCYLSGVVGFDRPRSIDTPRLSPLRRWIDLQRVDTLSLSSALTPLSTLCRWSVFAIARIAAMRAPVQSRQVWRRRLTRYPPRSARPYHRPRRC